MNSNLQKGNRRLLSPSNAIEKLKLQNLQLLEALMNIHQSQAIEKKRFHEILFGIDRALSSLPIRLENIRVRNQKNLSIMNSSRYNSGDGDENTQDPSEMETTHSEDSVANTSQSSVGQASHRMKSLLNKIDMVNNLIHTIQEGDTSSIELLVNSELYAISLLKKEIKSTKKRIEENNSETEAVTSAEESKQLDSCSKAKNSFSSELNKASNFKIFENHMMLQEEALDLLTRKIKETEEALEKETEEKEALKREKEALAKEIFRLKSSGEDECGGEKSEKREKLKGELRPGSGPGPGLESRPYRLIKELKTKLEEKEKFLIAWKSKYSRLEAVSANKTAALETEKKKNFELETTLKGLKAQNKSNFTQINSLQFLNDQLKDQTEILKHQVEILANEKINRENQTKNSKTEDKLKELGAVVKAQEEKMAKIQEEAEIRVQELKRYYDTTVEQLSEEVKKHEEKNEAFRNTFKELLVMLHSSKSQKELKNIKNSSYNRIREILNITPSDLEMLLSVSAKTLNKDVQHLYDEFKLIVDESETDFSETLATWFFDLIEKKLVLKPKETKPEDPNESK